MFAGLVRYDECERGMVEHAIRIIVRHTRREYLYPANHHASVPSTTDPDVPAMGQRLRLKSSFVDDQQFFEATQPHCQSQRAESANRQRKPSSNSPSKMAPSPSLNTPVAAAR
jgi:hypothetical protein